MDILAEVKHRPPCHVDMDGVRPAVPGHPYIVLLDEQERDNLVAEIERLTKWNHERLEELKERDIEVERLRAAISYALLRSPWDSEPTKVQTLEKLRKAIANEQLTNCIHTPGYDICPKCGR